PRAVLLRAQRRSGRRPAPAGGAGPPHGRAQARRGPRLGAAALVLRAAQERQRRSTTWSTQAVSASTSSGSTEGNIAMRSWLRPSLRYGSVSTMPLARRTFATSAASTESAKSMVPTTLDRCAGSATNGVVYEVFSAQV